MKNVSEHVRAAWARPLKAGPCRYSILNIREAVVCMGGGRGLCVTAAEIVLVVWFSPCTLVCVALIG